MSRLVAQENGTPCNNPHCEDRRRQLEKWPVDYRILEEKLKRSEKERSIACEQLELDGKYAELNTKKLLYRIEELDFEHKKARDDRDKCQQQYTASVDIWRQLNASVTAENHRVLGLVEIQRGKLEDLSQICDDYRRQAEDMDGELRAERKESYRQLQDLREVKDGELQSLREVKDRELQSLLKVKDGELQSLCEDHNRQLQALRVEVEKYKAMAETQNSPEQKLPDKPQETRIRHNSGGIKRLPPDDRQRKQGAAGIPRKRFMTGPSKCFECDHCHQLFAESKTGMYDEDDLAWASDCSSHPLIPLSFSQWSHMEILADDVERARVDESLQNQRYYLCCGKLSRNRPIGCKKNNSHAIRRVGDNSNQL